MSLHSRVANLETRSASTPPPERIHAGMTLIEAERAYRDTVRWTQANPVNTTTTTDVSPAEACEAYAALLKETNQ